MELSMVLLQDQLKNDSLADLKEHLMVTSLEAEESALYK